MTFDCPVDGCGNSHRIEHVMCGRCWARVPREMKARIHRAWGARKRFHGDERKVNEHEQAKDAAIAWVARTLR